MNGEKDISMKYVGFKKYMNKLSGKSFLLLELPAIDRKKNGKIEKMLGEKNDD